MLKKTILREVIDDSMVDFFQVSGMSLREFIEFWNSNHPRLVFLVNRRAKKAGKNGDK